MKKNRTLAVFFVMTWIHSTLEATDEQGFRGRYLPQENISLGFTCLVFTLSIRFQNRKCKAGKGMQNQRTYRARHLESQIVGGFDGAPVAGSAFSHMLVLVKIHLLRGCDSRWFKIVQSAVLKSTQCWMQIEKNKALQEKIDRDCESAWLKPKNHWH